MRVPILSNLSQKRQVLPLPPPALRLGGQRMPSFLTRMLCFPPGPTWQDVLTILITFSDLGFRSEEMLEAVELWTERRLNRLSPQGLSMTLWAFAYTGYRKPALLSTAVQACASLVEEFSAQQLARILWSFGKVRSFAAKEDGRGAICHPSCWMLATRG